MLKPVLFRGPFRRGSVRGYFIKGSFEGPFQTSSKEAGGFRVLRFKAGCFGLRVAGFRVLCASGLGFRDFSV